MTQHGSEGGAKRIRLSPHVTKSRSPMAKRTIKITRADLEQGPDIELADKAFLWLKKHGQKLVTGAILVCAAIAVVGVMKQRKEATLAAANDALYAATQKYEDALQAKQWGTDERAASMREVVADAEKVQKDFAGTPLNHTALFLKGNAYYFSGDKVGTSANTEQAIKVFTEYVQVARQEGSAFEIASGLLALGYAQENLAQLQSNNQKAAIDAYTAAVKAYDEVIATKDAGFLRAEAMNAKARLILLNNNDRKGAEDLYRKVLEERFYNLPEPPADAQMGDRVVYQIRQAANQFTTENTARIGLERLGVDVEALDKELAAKSATKK